MTIVEKAVYERPLTAAETTTLEVFAAIGTYAFGRCGKHGLIAVLDAAGALRAAQEIACPNDNCRATVVFIASPLDYAKEREIPRLTFTQIVERMKAEGISVKDFVRHGNRPQWMGDVEWVTEESYDRTKRECEWHEVVFHLPHHGLFVQAHGIKDGEKGNRKWDYKQYGHFRQVAPVEQPLSPSAYTVTYEPIPAAA